MFLCDCRFGGGGGLGAGSKVGGGGSKVTIQRSPSAVKQMLLDWCKHQTQGYEVGLEVDSFSKLVSPLTESVTENLDPNKIYRCQSRYCLADLN